MKQRRKKFFKNLFRGVQRYQISIMLALIGLALVGAGLSVSKFMAGYREPQFIPGGETSESSIKVDIEGAVKKPGVYTLASGARVSDVVEQAGGFAADADQSWVAQNLNLAAKLSDGQKVYIPAVGGSGTVASEVAGKININTASASELDRLPDIGPVRAEKIIAGRPYASLEELLAKKIVGETTFEKIKDKITVY